MPGTPGGSLPQTVRQSQVAATTGTALTSQTHDLGGTTVELAFDADQISSEDLLHVVHGLRRGWTVACERGWMSSTLDAWPVQIVVEQGGEMVVRDDRLRLSVDKLQALRGRGRNLTYVAVAIIAAIHFKLGMKATGEALDLVQEGFDGAYIRKVLGVLEPV